MALGRLATRLTGTRVSSVVALLTITVVAVGLRPACAATITVNSTGDTVTVDGAVTLREAIASINMGSNVNTDVMASGYGTNDTILFNLTLPALIKLTSNTELAIMKDMTISGPAIGVVAVDGNNATRVFDNFFGTTLTMENLTIQNGKQAGDGGGIWNDGTVILTNCIIDHNTASANGGGFFNEGSSMATLTRCTLSNNTATNGAGGGFSNNGVTGVMLTDCTLSGNTAGTDGGGIWNNGDMLAVTRCTFSGNKAPSGCGGGFFNGVPNVTVTNSTFSSNSATYGGGFCNQSTATMANCTLSGNSATALGGAIFNSVPFTLSNTIMANSTSGKDCFNNGSITNSHNLIETDSSGTFGSDACSDGMNGDIVGSDPLLGPLANNGGPTQTFALCEAPGVPDASCTGRSPAIDAGDDSVTGPPLNLTTDQRILTARLFGLHVDIGSFEVQPFGGRHLAPALSTIGMMFLAALLGLFGWWRPRTRRTRSMTP